MTSYMQIIMHVGEMLPVAGIKANQNRSINQWAIVHLHKQHSHGRMREFGEFGARKCRPHEHGKFNVHLINSYTYLQLPLFNNSCP